MVEILFIGYFLFLMILMVRHRLMIIFYFVIAVVKILMAVISSTIELFFQTGSQLKETEGERSLYLVYQNREHFIGKKLDYIISKVGKPSNSKKYVVTWKSGGCTVSAWINKKGKCIDMNIVRVIEPPADKK